VNGVGPPTYHLGGDFTLVTEPKNVLKYEKMFGEEVPKYEIHAPLEPGDCPELEESHFCPP
jgi:hypothetical protein